MVTRAKDLAELLGVSQTTLSMIINNKGNISQKTRDRVIRELTEMGYGEMLHQGNSVPAGAGADDTAARETSRGCIGFVLYKDSGLFINNTSFFPLLLDGMDKAARRLGYRFMVINIASDMDRQSKLAYIKESGCAGFVIYAPELTEADADELRQMNIDFVLLDQYFPDKNINSVTLDNEQGICALLKLLKRKGHTRVGFLSGGVDIQSFAERREAFLKHAPAFGMELYESGVLEIDYPEEEAFRRMDEYLQAFPAGTALPTAFLSDNDCVALGAIRALQKHGYRVPEQVSVAGFADRPQCMYVTPNITTMRIPRDMFGGEAVDMLVNKVMTGIGREESCVMHTKLSLRLIERDSVADAPG